MGVKTHGAPQSVTRVVNDACTTAEEQKRHTFWKTRADQITVYAEVGHNNQLTKSSITCRLKEFVYRIVFVLKLF